MRRPPGTAPAAPTGTGRGRTCWWQSLSGLAASTGDSDGPPTPGGADGRRPSRRRPPRPRDPRGGHRARRGRARPARRGGPPVGRARHAVRVPGLLPERAPHRFSARTGEHRGLVQRRAVRHLRDRGRVSRPLDEQHGRPRGRVRSARVRRRLRGRRLRPPGRAHARAPRGGCNALDRRMARASVRAPPRMARTRAGLRGPSGGSPGRATTAPSSPCRARRVRRSRWWATR